MDPVPATDRLGRAALRAGCFSVSWVVEVEVFPAFEVGDPVAFEVGVVVFDGGCGEHRLDGGGAGVVELSVEARLFVVVFVPGDEAAEGPWDVVLGHGVLGRDVDC